MGYSGGALVSLCSDCGFTGYVSDGTTITGTFTGKNGNHYSGSGTVSDGSSLSLSCDLSGRSGTCSYTSGSCAGSGGVSLQ
jgi:hypothetical protein